MRIPAVTVRTKQSDERSTGLLLAYLSVLMKANKTKQVGPINHFFQERLERRADRADLNVMLNALASKLASTSPKFKNRQKPVLDSAASVHDTQEYRELEAKYNQVLDQLRHQDGSVSPTNPKANEPKVKKEKRDDPDNPMSTVPEIGTY
jgi:hypothetical protein